MSPRLRTAIPLALAVAIGAALWLRTAPVERAVLEDPLPTYTPFTVTTASGALALTDLAGQAVVVYFGYTTCPDICPTTMATMGAAWKLLSEADRARATVLLVSVDPERDTPARLQEYVGYFNKRFRAGTAPLPEVTRIAADWGVAFRKVGDTGSALGYMIDHSTQAFLVDARGRMVTPIDHGTPAEVVAQRVRDALARD
jgi:protein SCO1/2